MYVVYLYAELYGITKSREEAFKVIDNFIKDKFGNEVFYEELKENLDSSYKEDKDFTDGGDCWALYTDNIF